MSTQHFTDNIVGISAVMSGCTFVLTSGLLECRWPLRWHCAMVIAMQSDVVMVIVMAAWRLGGGDGDGDGDGNGNGDGDGANKLVFLWAV